MNPQEINILIIDDDASLGKAISELVRREGFHPHWVTKPDEVSALLKVHHVHLAIIDCMLPKMNGRDLAVKIQGETGGNTPVILMSGIYKDKAYIKESIQQTGAYAYLVKPFQLDELKKLIHEKIKAAPESKNRMMPIYNLMSQSQLSAAEKIEIVNDTDVLHGYDLPWVYSLLLDQEITGCLNIQSSTSNNTTVHFDHGRIVRVHMTDQESFFGALLIEHGYISAADLDRVMQSPQSKKKLGERLVEMNLLSPHAIDIILAEQQGIRLSKTVADSSNKVSFVASQEEVVEAEIDRNLFDPFLEDWIGSKIKTEWLKAFYMPWLNHSLVPLAEYKQDHPAIKLLRAKNQGHFLDEIYKKRSTLESLLVRFEGHEANLLKCIHLLILSRLFHFGTVASKRDFEAQTKRFEKINEEMDRQNYFERLGLSTKAKETEIKRAYLDLAKVLHPDKLLPETPEKLRELVTEVYEKITISYQVLSNSEQRSHYLSELESGNAEQALQAATLTEEGKNYLRKGDIRKAHECFQQAIAKASPSTDLRLMMIWAKLKMPGFQAKADVLQRIKEDIASIPPEDRHSPVYYFIKGLMLYASQDFEMAKKSYEHAVSLDADFIEARRELNLLRHETTQLKTKNTNILDADLKDVVSMLFQPKNKKAK